MKNKKFASFLAAAAALVLLAMPAFAADEQTELPAAEAAEVQQEQTAAPAEQETALPADAQTAGEPEQQLTYVALGDSITSGVGLADMKYNIAQIGYDLQPNFEGYPSQCYTALVGKGLGLDRQHAINLGVGIVWAGSEELWHVGWIAALARPGKLKARHGRENRAVGCRLFSDTDASDGIDIGEFYVLHIAP